VRESGRPIVASVSGGKDSTAMALWLKHEAEIEKTNQVHFIFADTGWEHPELYTYLDEVIEPLLGENFIRVRSKKYPGGMPELVEKRGMFPSRKIRFCTQELKVFPIRDFIKDLDEWTSKPPINAVGIRAAESKRRSQMEEWEGGGPMDVDTWRPLINWLIEDVVAIHTKYSVRPCPLYLRDELPASRVGCWPCIMSRKSEIRSVVETDPDRIVQIRTLEEKVADRARERYAKKGETFESRGVGKPAFFQAKTGRGGECWPIDKVAEWAQTEKGGYQYGLELFVPNDPSERGCQLWGLCDLPDENGEFAP